LTVEQLIGANMRRARQQRGMAQEELGRQLARYLGRPLTRQAISLAEKGQRDFRAAELVAIARELDKPMSFFFAPEAPGQQLDFPGGWTIPAADVVAAFMTADTQTGLARFYGLEAMQGLVEQLQFQLQVVTEELRKSLDTVAILRELPGEAAGETDR
jgi:transcriptional regulator with XRE-family HTH domain